MRRPLRFRVALAFLLLLSCVLVFEVKLPEASALVLFSDDFATLNNMNVINGVWTTSGSLLQGTAANGEALAWTGELSWMYYKATANLRTVNPGGEAGLVVRYTDPPTITFLGWAVLVTSIVFQELWMVSIKSWLFQGFTVR